MVANPARIKQTPLATREYIGEDNAIFSKHPSKLHIE
jgi:hypothetical protein